MKFLTDENKVTLAFKSLIPITDDDELKTKLENLGYVTPDKNHIVIKLTTDRREIILKRWEKNETEIYYDPGRGFLSAEGTDIEETSLGFKDICSIAKEMFGDEFESKIKWAEINFHGRCIGNKYPLEALESSLKHDIYTDLGKILNTSVNPFSLILYSTSEEPAEIALNAVENWYHISIEPLVLNPKYYAVRLVFRDKDISKVETLSSTIENIFTSLIEYLEG